MNFKSRESAKKLRGGYYTSIPIARFLNKWVLRISPKTILEPGCGDGAFARALLGLHRHRISFSGIEINQEEAAKAKRAAAANRLIDPTIINSGFLQWALTTLDAGETFEAVVGNPPYIRYQYLEENDQKLSERLFLRYQLKFTKHTNAWVPFVIASIGLLATGGQLAMVIPAELLHIIHAGSLRQFLLTHCRRILLIDPNELLFDQALQGTVLLLAEKKSSALDRSEGVAVLSAPNNDFLDGDPEKFFSDSNYISGDILNGKWMKVFLTPDELMAFETARGLKDVRAFGQVASVDIGIVTGANEYFLVDNATVSKYRLQKFAQPMFGRSEHCPGIIYDSAVHRENQARSLPTNFLMFGDVEFRALPAGAQEYIRLGETQDLHKRYKCRIRSPWYSVPSVYATRVGMLKRSHNFPRLILNRADAYTTDTAYRIRPTDCSANRLVFCFINSLTALTAELEGRHYGGGVLELVPSEIEKLLVPLPSGIEPDLPGLNARVRSNDDAEKLLMEQDEIILKRVGLTASHRELIHTAWNRIRSRRHRLLDKSPTVGKEDNE